MQSDVTTYALISVRCPYCVDGLKFRPMQLMPDGAFTCPCGHTAKPRESQFRCACSHCASAAKGVALLAETAISSSNTENPREAEILHSVSLLHFEAAMHNSGTENPEVDSRELKIKKQLVALYEQQKAFAHPTPSEEPADYEPEELESWADLQNRIAALEDELARITPDRSERA